MEAPTPAGSARPAARRGGWRFRGWLTFYFTLIWYWIYIVPIRNRCALRGRPIRLRSAYARYPLLCRPGTSDLFMFKQIFVEREYSCLDALTAADLIVDCGANVGYSSAYFLSRFPEARLVAVEPEAENFAILKQNLVPFGDRATLKQTGVWSHPCGLVLVADPRSFQENSRQVREARAGEIPMFHATDIGTILAESGAERISILKI